MKLKEMKGPAKGWKAFERVSPLLIFLVALIVRLTVWWFIPVDWNWDSYHH